MTGLIAAAAGFVLLHLLVSGTRARDVLTAAMGQGAYSALFSLASVALLAWLGFAFARARSGGGDPTYWSASHLTLMAQLIVQFVAFFFVVVGLLTPNPASVRQEGSLERADVARGMLRITRHPFLWGVAIWAGGHLLVNGDVAGIVLFGSMLALALLGTVSIDAKRWRALGEKWQAFADQTSNLPFAAIASGRQSLKIGEIGWWRPLTALIVWAALILVHAYAFGVSAAP